MGIGTVGLGAECPKTVVFVSFSDFSLLAGGRKSIRFRYMESSIIQYDPFPHISKQRRISRIPPLKLDIVTFNDKQAPTELIFQSNFECLTI